MLILINWLCHLKGNMKWGSLIPWVYEILKMGGSINRRDFQYTAFHIQFKPISRQAKMKNIKRDGRNFFTVSIYCTDVLNLSFLIRNILQRKHEVQISHRIVCVHYSHSACVQSRFLLEVQTIMRWSLSILHWSGETNVPAIHLSSLSAAQE